jgi:sucrose phosphorylase
MAELGRVKRILKRIYGEREGELALERIMPLIERFSVKKSGKEGYFSQEDVVLITYGDSLLGEGQVPLVTLHDFANTYLLFGHGFLHHQSRTGILGGSGRHR